MADGTEEPRDQHERLTEATGGERWFRKPGDRKTVATYNVASPELGGVVGNKLDRHGAPYGLTEEFVEIYRLHSLLPETLRLRRHDSGVDLADVPLVTTRQAGSAKLTGRIGMTDLFYSFGNQHPGALVLHNYPRFMQELSIPGNPVFDMGAVDILRARERGVPATTSSGVSSASTRSAHSPTSPTTPPPRGDHGDGTSLDLLVGTLAEAHRPTGFGFGETMFQIFILNATRRLQADRFYTDDFREEVYTPEGLLDRPDQLQSLLRHFPELASTGLANIKRFELWDTEASWTPPATPYAPFDPR